MKMSGQGQQHLFSAIILRDSPEWDGQTRENLKTREGESSWKNGYSEGEELKTKKRRFKNYVIRAARSREVVGAKAPIASTTDRPTHTDIGKPPRHANSKIGSHQYYVSRFSKRKEGKNKKDRKESIDGSFTSILGSSPQITHDERDPSPLGTISSNAEVAAAVTNTVQNYRTSKLRKEKIKKERRRRVIGSLTSILGPDEDSLVVGDDAFHSELGVASANAPDLINAPGNVDIPCNRKRRTALNNSRATKRRNEKNKENQKKSTNGTLPSTTGTSSSVSSNIDAHIESAVVAKATATDGLGSPIVLEQSESDEIEARDQLRAKLRREQLKNAALASLKAKIKANQLTSTVPGLTMLSKSIRASNAKEEGNGVCQRPDRVTSTVPASSSLLTYSNATNATSQRPRLKSRARNQRLYSVSMKIPPPVPEDSVFEEDDTVKVPLTNTSQNNRTFTSRPPLYPRRVTSSNTITRARIQRKYSIVKPHPTESKLGCSSENNRPFIKDSGGGELEDSRQKKFRYQKNKRLMFNRWLANQ